MSDDSMERYRLAGEEAARLDGRASDLEEIRKIKFSELVNRADASSIAKAEHWARASEEYRAAHDEAVTARTNANVKKAGVKAMEMSFEKWRTLQATRRAEMSLR